MGMTETQKEHMKMTLKKVCEYAKRHRDDFIKSIQVSQALMDSSQRMPDICKRNAAIEQALDYASK